jgi:hypothetical protein
MLPAAQPGGGMLSPLDSADASFRALITGHQPLALHAASLAVGLPDRQVPLDELRVLLLHPATGARARNQVWAELVRRARPGSPAWVVGLVGVAMPGLRRAAATLAASYRSDPADLHIEILAGFLAAIRALDPDDLDRVPLASRLCWAAWRAGQALACTDASYAAARRDLPDSYDAPYMPGGHPDFVLAAAVARGVLTPAQARLIGRNRLEGIPLAQIAGELGISHTVTPCATGGKEPRKRSLRRSAAASFQIPEMAGVKSTPGNRISVSAGVPLLLDPSRGRVGPGTGRHRTR